MNSFITLNKAKISSILFFQFLAMLPLIAQKQDVFHDSLGVQGVVFYSGETSNNKLPKQGAYSIQWREINNELINTYLINGQLNNHLPQGSWLWQQGNWAYSINAAKTIQPTFSTNGTVAKWVAYFEKGIPERNWTYTLDSVDANGRVVENFIQIKISFKNGKPVGKFSVEDKRKPTNFKLTGNTNNEGAAIGDWLYTFSNNLGETTTEKHLYKNGLLQNVTIYANDTIEINYKDNQDFFFQIENESIVKIIGDLSFHQSEYASNSNNLWVNITQNYFQNGWQLHAFPFQFPLSIPSFKRLEYPLSKEELTQKSNIKNNSANIQNTINNYIKGEMFIERSRSSVMDLSISFLEQTQKRMHLLDSLMMRTELPTFTYKNRYQAGVLHYIEAINALSETKAKVYDTLSVFLPTIQPNDKNFQLFKELEAFTQTTQNSLNQHFEIIASESINIQHENERKELEEELIAKLKKLQEMFNFNSGIGAQIQQKWIDENLQQEIIRYAQKDDYQLAMSLGNQILLRIDTISLLHNRVAIFDSMPQRIFEEYHRMVYNPYTGKNDLQLTIRKRFLTTVLENLWPWLEQNIEKEQNWDNWKQLWEQQFSVYNFVMTFANRQDKQAQKLNKKARKETNPERLLKMLQ